MKLGKIITAVVFVILLLMATLWVWHLNGKPVIGIDDSNIFFSYAENLASGNGITYAHNGEHVEGYTSSLWMIICASMFFAGFNELGILLLSVCIFVLTQFIFFKIIRDVCTRKKGCQPFIYQAVFACIILFSPAYITWMTITLMDTVLWGLILAGITYFIVSPPNSTKSRGAISILFALAPLARPESFVVVPAFMVILWIRLQQKKYSHQLKACLFSITAFLVGISLLTLFRLFYFGHPLPNTYYAKVSPSLLYNLQEGSKYMYDFFSSGTIAKSCIIFSVIMSILWLLITLSRAFSAKKREMILAPTVSASAAVSLGISALLLVTLLTGGDHFPLFRFLQPIYPIMCLAPVVWAAEHDISSQFQLYFKRKGFENKLLNKIAGSIIILLFALFMFLGYSDSSWKNMIKKSPLDFQFRIAERYMKRGEIIRNIFSQTGYMPSVGVISAGGIARSYPGKIFDLMGLNNEAMAHCSGDRKGIRGHSAFQKDEFFKEKPDILIASPPIPPATENFFTKVLNNLYMEPEFIEGWRYGTAALKNDPENSITAYINVNCIYVIKKSNNASFKPIM
jgi:4-amino-4-deoxy-L-arabinose transferase-like glycosyltransferase